MHGPSVAWPPETRLDLGLVEPLLLGVLGGAGATATFVSFEEERWQWAQVGDTRAYRLREGFFEKLTPEEARDFPHRNVITRAIGVTEKVEPDFGSFEVERGDRLLLCSDGLWGELDDRTIARLLHDHPEPEEACGALLDAANRAGGRDNITALVANVG